MAHIPDVNVKMRECPAGGFVAFVTINGGKESSLAAGDNEGKVFDRAMKHLKMLKDAPDESAEKAPDSVPTEPPPVKTVAPDCASKT